MIDRKIMRSAAALFEAIQVAETDADIIALLYDQYSLAAEHIEMAEAAGYDKGHQEGFDEGYDTRRAMEAPRLSEGQAGWMPSPAANQMPTPLFVDNNGVVHFDLTDEDLEFTARNLDPRMGWSKH